MRKPINSGLVVAIGLPLFAIAASLSVAVVAFTRGDPTLPDEYHWEGMSLDRDFADARQAVALDVSARLRLEPQTGTCRVMLEIQGRPPSALQLRLVHGAHPDLDRQVRLEPDGAVYAGHCGEVPMGQWHLELSDMAHSWSIREDVSGDLDGFSMPAHSQSALPDR
jgi:hypothetical protein